MAKVSPSKALGQLHVLRYKQEAEVMTELRGNIKPLPAVPVSSDDVILLIAAGAEDHKRVSP